MRFTLRWVVCAVTLAALVGCETVQQKAAKPTVPGEAAPEVAAPELPPPSMKGKVFRVWPYGNGEMMALLGTKDGVREGDMLMITREGDPVNAVEVLDVHQETFFGRVFVRHAPELLPRVGDFAVRAAVLQEPEAAPEKPASAEPEKKE
ncbi:MAG: hypothetical protein AMK75_04870 [Planctomycetes bacterium SM23_65]|nr:MAG: hypothetical protein AMK75_04870 [Planctomycetes bacterium SM23_65]